MKEMERERESEVGEGGKELLGCCVFVVVKCVNSMCDVPCTVCERNKLPTNKHNNPTTLFLLPQPRFLFLFPFLSSIFLFFSYLFLFSIDPSPPPLLQPPSFQYLHFTLIFWPFVFRAPGEGRV